MAILTGIFTSKGRETLAKSFGQIGGFPYTNAVYFKIGMGGYIVSGDGRVPKAPNPALLDIEATGAAGDFFLQKNLVTTDFTFIAPSTMQVRCRVEPTEANDDGNGNAPRFFELGLFDANNNLLIYSTFPEQTKQANKILTNFVQAYF